MRKETLMSRLAVFVPVLFFCLLGGSALAHHVWILTNEPGGVLQVHFGEFAENLKEVSPGLLDRIEVSARFVSAKGETSLETKRAIDAIALSGHAGPGENVIAEDARAPVRERKSGEQASRSVYNPAARFATDFTAREPVLTLDVVPTGRPGQFKVAFRGAPLRKAKVSVMAASGWGRELRTDEAGAFQVELPWKAPYAIEVSHADNTPGSRGGQSFDLTNFVTTLSFVQTIGLEPLAPLPAAKPHG